MRLNASSSCGLTAILQEAAHVLDVRLLEEPQAAGDDVRDVAAREFHLQFHRVVMGAIKHGDLVQRHAFVAQFKNPLRDELRLLVAVGTRRSATA